jgi:hypothetical protein
MLLFFGNTFVYGGGSRKYAVETIGVCSFLYAGGERFQGCRSTPFVVC